MIELFTTVLTALSYAFYNFLKSFGGKDNRNKFPNKGSVERLQIKWIKYKNKKLKLNSLRNERIQK